MKELKDHEGQMAKSQLERSMKYSKMIYKMIQNVDKGKGVEFPAWVQSKLAASSIVRFCLLKMISLPTEENPRG